jgi:hypothetical protein
MALQEAHDAYLAKYFQDVNLAPIHTGRVTIKDKDFAFVRSFRHEDILFNPSIPEGIELAHKKQTINRNRNSEGVDALRQVERGRGNETRLADDDLGPGSR